MNVNELIEELEQCDGDKEVYIVGIGGDFLSVESVKPDVSHNKLSIVPYEEENFVWLQW